MFVDLDTLETEVRHLVDGLDPGSLAPVDAADAVVALARVARIAMAGVTILAQRAGDATTWRAKHKPDVGAWLGYELGLSYTDGRRLHEASTLLGDARVTRDLMVAGAIPPLAAAEIVVSRDAARRARERAAARYAAEQARREAEAAAAGQQPPPVGEPDLGKTPGQVEQRLADLAQEETTDLHRLREEAERAKAAARDEEAQAEHLHRSRYWRPRLHPDGAPGGGYKSTPELDAAIQAALRAETDRLFRHYRRVGIRVPREACAFDALYKLITGHDAPARTDSPAPPPPAPAPSRRGYRPGRRSNSRPTPTTGPRPSTPAAPPAPATTFSEGAAPTTTAPPAEAVPPPELCFGNDTTAPAIAPRAGRRRDVVVRVDAGALHRGFLLAGETCEIAGLGPIPIETARRLAGRARIDIVLHDAGGKVLNVTCAGTRLRHHLHPATGPPPPHPTRVVLRLDTSTLRADSTEAVHVAGVGRVDPAALAAILPPPAVALILEHGIDPRTIVRSARQYPRPLDVAFREEHPYCVDCGSSMWLERDHELPVALDGKTRLDNLIGRCPRCHRAKTQREAPRTIRAGRQRNTERRSRAPAAP